VRTFFTSDTHFGDHRVLNLYPRPFANVTEMDVGLIARWNAVVGRDDEVWHLGDFARTPAIAAAVLLQLAGRKHLVLGNNDPGSQPRGWQSVSPYAQIERDGVTLVPCHYPFRSCNGQHRRSWDLHGHMELLLRQADVGVDVGDYTPVSLPTLMSKGRKRRAVPA